MELKNKELIEFLVKIEQEGQEFYKKLAGQVSDPHLKSYFMLMSSDESSHEKIIKKSLGKQEDRKYGWEDNPSLREFVDAHLIQGLFPDLDENLEDLPAFERIQKVLNAALKSEELHIEFYKTLSECCNDFGIKCLMIGLESEEKAHYSYVQYLIEDLKKKSG